MNCVVMKGFNDNELRDFVQLGRHTPVDIRFIEWMPFSGNRWDERFMSYKEMQEDLALANNPSSENNTGEGGDNNGESRLGFVLKRDVDGANDTTKWWRAESSDGVGVGEEFLGRVGFITSMSANFCGTCNRLRLMADGKIKVRLVCMWLYLELWCDGFVGSLSVASIRRSSLLFGVVDCVAIMCWRYCLLCLLGMFVW